TCSSFGCWRSTLTGVARASRQTIPGKKMTTTTETQLDSATRYGLVALAITQGYALYFLHLAVENTFWPVTELPWLKAFYSVAIGLPVFFYLGMERLNDRRTLIAGAGLGVLLFG